MAASKVRAVIFDIGRVLIRIDVARAMSKMAFGLTLSPEELWTAIERDPRWRDWQEGRISPRDWHLHIKQRFGGSATFEQFRDSWNLVLDPKPIQGAGLFERLSKHYRLGLLSNTDPIHVAYMEPRYDFFPYFTARVYSCGIGASKPSPVIYKAALKVCKSRAEEAVYIDDIEAYVDAARSLGMKGLHFRSPDQLETELRGLGLDI